MRVMNLSRPGPTPAGVPRCRWCKKPLRVYDADRRGYNGDGLFCSLRCAYDLALVVIRRIEIEKVVVVPEEFEGELGSDGILRITEASS